MQNILCIPNRESFRTGVHALGVHALSKNLLDEADFLPREPLETDETKRQIIPYVLVWSGSNLLTYRRRGSEGRLRDKLSIGIGGHVDEADFTTSHFFATYRAAMREIQEELGLESPTHYPWIEGPRHIIVDNSDEVGRVHLGLLFQVKDIDPKHIEASSEIAEVNFLPPAAIPREDLEGWSRLVLDWILAEGE